MHVCFASSVSPGVTHLTTSHTSEFFLPRVSPLLLDVVVVDLLSMSSSKFGFSLLPWGQIQSRPACGLVLALLVTLSLPALVRVCPVR